MGSQSMSLRQSFADLLEATRSIAVRGGRRACRRRGQQGALSDGDRCGPARSGRARRCRAARAGRPGMRHARAGPVVRARWRRPAARAPWCWPCITASSPAWPATAWTASSSATTCGTWWTRPRLLASMTSEVGTYGDTRSSICAVRAPGGAVSARQGRDHRFLLRARRRDPGDLPPRRGCRRQRPGAGAGAGAKTARWRRPRAGTRWACAAPAAPGSGSSPSGPQEQIVPGLVRGQLGPDHGAVFAHPLVVAVVGHRGRRGGQGVACSCAARPGRRPAPCRRPPPGWRKCRCCCRT